MMKSWLAILGCCLIALFAGSAAAIPVQGLWFGCTVRRHACCCGLQPLQPPSMTKDLICESRIVELRVRATTIEDSGRNRSAQLVNIGAEITVHDF
ncbi:MAG: hypothetical protein R3C59_08780 [Planctomycetaceae bacterium]